MGLRGFVQRVKNRRKYGYSKKNKFNSSSFSGTQVGNKGLSIGRKKHVDLQRRDIDKVVKEATSKYLTKPDQGLNQKVVAAIRSGYYLAETTSKNVALALSDRLRAKNPTKVMLSVVLTRKVLAECKEVLAPVKHELLLEIATIAARPVRSDVVNHGMAFMARMEAFNTLKEYGDDGKEAMEQVAGAGAAQLIDAHAPNLEGGAPVPEGHYDLAYENNRDHFD
jgi:hypothetical protein